jgi:hypothetical protein
MPARRIFIVAFLAAAVLSLPAVAVEDPKAAGDGSVREVSLEGYKAAFPKTRVDAPTIIASAEELGKAFADKDVLDRLTKEVDFTKEKLLFFAWSGSGQDKLGHAIGDAKEIVFTYTPGRTKDLRSHAKLFAIGKDAKWKMAGKK